MILRDRRPLETLGIEAVRAYCLMQKDGHKSAWLLLPLMVGAIGL
jgi:hypothetical protein